MVTKNLCPVVAGRTVNAALKRLGVPAPSRVLWGDGNGL